jgi:hypothetical protein
MTSQRAPQNCGSCARTWNSGNKWPSRGRPYTQLTHAPRCQIPGILPLLPPRQGRALTSRYRRELQALPRTYQTCLAWDIMALTRVIETLANGPLAIVGSGGSFSGAVFGATLHELHTRQFAKAVTPLQVVSAPALPGRIARGSGRRCRQEVVQGLQAGPITAHRPVGAGQG